MEERSLRLVGTDKTFFNKLTNTLTKLLIPTQIGINGMRISMKRNAVIKAYQSADEDEKKYEDAYTAYLEALDKYVLDTIYKKVKNQTASELESAALSQYYGIVQLKESEYVEYKYRKQKYLLELDNESVKNTAKEKVIEKHIYEKNNSNINSNIIRKKNTFDNVDKRKLKNVLINVGLGIAIVICLILIISMAIERGII